MITTEDSGAEKASQYHVKGTREILGLEDFIQEKEEGEEAVAMHHIFPVFSIWPHCC